MMLNKVDLPQPEGPMTARNSPGATVKETFVECGRPRLPRSWQSASRYPRRRGSRRPCRGCRHAVTRCRRDSGHRLAIVWSVSGARHRRGHDRGIAGLDADIDDGHLAGIDRGNGLFEHAGEIAWLGHRAEADARLGRAPWRRGRPRARTCAGRSICFRPGDCARAPCAPGAVRRYRTSGCWRARRAAGFCNAPPSTPR